uniref:Uncharacterized protein n=1 Tax=Candidatus Methanogaster sp. ANME-2c ERB4 TaxID=2759911 RepID=A0A7G9YAU0_9EURY|nr:hypothetical protein MOOKMAHM_00007 [Methanosarcinales archaeon ANME-2c ERB4]QNO45124.1 hypothetical protein AGMAKMMB_00011 [Methanosarcinales archaeon ANME-2c ERB4]QNO50370.1 hypothetical protein BOLHPIDD_00011 [Methanosarcinales archaeon ANME-2c ERB4]
MQAGIDTVEGCILYRNKSNIFRDIAYKPTMQTPISIPSAFIRVHLRLIGGIMDEECGT